MTEDKKLDIGDLAKKCLDTIIVYPDLEYRIKLYYINALYNMEQGKSQSLACKVAIESIDELIYKKIEIL